ncbi:uncharacterized protein N7529_006036 [Penicillium soppii]|uniref:uncharacterized protein n=1 Tax=Penicillium soppii TaxID=69789 RepID=UPI002547D429|nr:uncharacterized protein N7529_006036 [Penicillium soppii]KAJ5864120.1 hypothetical protein N7529_006036 [Penicillium soppii]
MQSCRIVYILGYPIPVFNGWNKSGEFDASVTHLAKVRNVMRYLDSLNSASEDDLVLMIDGYDVVFQLPADVLIQRYFAVIGAANAKIAAHFGADSVDELVGDNSPRQTILFGPEKICYPLDWNRPGCWAIPEDIDIPVGAFGPDDGQLSHNLPRWLNSGTILGPVGDMKELFAATLEKIKATYDPIHEFSDSDQRYMSDVWGEQEFWRSVNRHNQYFHDDVNPKDIAPKGDPDQIIPTREAGQKTEFHIGIDYKSGLFQTRVGSDHVLEHLSFPNSVPDGIGLWASVSENPIESPNPQPYEIYLPTNVVSSLSRLLKPISHTLEADQHSIVSSLRLGTNLVTKNIYGLFHCIGEKTYLDDLWYRLWFQKHAKALLEARLESSKEDNKISDILIDGRKWVVAHGFPTASNSSVHSVGAWVDMDGQWLTWEELCEPYEGNLFGDKLE